MTRARVISAAWTTVVVVSASSALLAIVLFMARAYRSFTTVREAPPAVGVVAEVDAGVEATPLDTPPARAADSPSANAALPVPSAPEPSSALVHALRARQLTIPVQGVTAAALVPSFAQVRGERSHEAIDIMAPAGTPVVAVEDGTVARLFTSEAGGLTVYQFDPTHVVAYYYAHLQGYAPGLVEGAAVRRGQVIGYVGSTGNANAAAPHLHFAIFRLGPEGRWWDGTPIDPYGVFR